MVVSHGAEFVFPPLDALPKLQQIHIDFLSARGIDVDKIGDAHVFPARAYFRDLGREGPALAFPYIKNGKIYAAKLRSIEGKHFTWKGAGQNCYGDEALDVSPGSTVILVEGEMDRLALMASDVSNVLSVPNGANLGSSDQADWMGDLAPRLKQCRVVLAGDMDEPGLKLRAELSRRIGRARCFTADWPEGCKDANATLERGGPPAVVQQIAAAVPMPVDGLVEASAYASRLDDLYNGLMAHGVDVGLGSEVNKLFQVPFGFLTVLTGWPNDGKSTCLDNILVHLAEKHDLKVAIWSPENGPEIHIAKLIEIHAGFPFFNGSGQRLTPEKVKEHLGWVNSKFFFLVEGEETEANIESILDRIEAAVQRYGIRVAVIDPYNHISKPDVENEVEWIRRLLIRIKRFAQSHGIHIFLVAHPRQLPSGSRRFPPTGFHISGGAPWNAITDFGITVYRPKVETDDWETNNFEGQREPDNEVHFIAWKVRHKWHGRRGIARLEFDASNSRYYEAIPQSRPMPPRPFRRWDLDDDDDI